MVNFIIVWQESDGHVQVHRYSTEDPGVIAMIRRTAGQFIYHQHTEDFDEQENEVESLGVDMEERVPLIDHSTKEIALLNGSFEVIVTGYYLGKPKKERA